MSNSLAAIKFGSQVANCQPKALVFIDANVDDHQYLASGVLDGLQVRILPKNRDGILAIATELHKFAAINGPIDTVHIVSHGSPGQLQLGTATLNSQTLKQYETLLQYWKYLLSDDADLLIYGCNVAAANGESFIKQLSELTGANVAASADLTGNTAEGGNWNLEVSTGKIKAPLALKPEVMAAYKDTLAIFTVTNNADSGSGSLRDAIASAAAGDTIVFDPSLANQTITLTSGQILINAGKNLTIDGANAPNLTLSGNNASRIFFVDANVDFNTTATIKNLKFINGYVSPNAGAGPTNSNTQGRGGAIAGPDQANLIIDNVQFNNNVADKGGGAIYLDWNSNLTVTNSKFEGNKATASNDERGAGAIAFVSPGNLIVRNSEFRQNLGINGGAINSLNTKLTIENSQFIGNDTTAGSFATGQPNDFLRGYGGAIYTDRASSGVEENQGIGGTIRITGSVFEGNRAKAGGGANYLFTAPTDQVIIEDTTYTNNQVAPLPGGVDGGKGGGLYQISNSPNRGLTIRNTTFANNIAAEQGGGVWLYNAPGTITNSTFTKNRAEAGNFVGNGGAIAILGSTSITTDIVNTTIADNFANGLGGGVFAVNEINPQVNVKNTIFANNTVGNQFGTAPQSTRRLTDQGGNIQWPPTNNSSDLVTDTITVADPKLGPLQNINGALVLPLLPGSAAIDGGTNAGAPITDQRGATRPVDGDGNGSVIVDSGAYEASGSVSLAPEIEVLDNTTNIADGTTTALDFGTTTVGSALTKTFTVKNTGTADLSLTTPTLPAGFSLIGDFPATVASNGTAAFQVQLAATAAGTNTGTLSFGNNDSDENPFDFAIAGTVTGNGGVPNPTITNITSTATDGNYSVGQVIPIAVTFSEVVNVTGTPQLTLETGTSDAVIDYASGSGTNTLTFNYTVRTGDTTADLDYISTTALALNGGTIKDAVGDDAILGLPAPGASGSLGANKAIAITPPSINIIQGTAGRDVLTGTSDSDRLIGEQVSDILIGGGGNDEFVYNRLEDAADIILDFQVGSDKIVMTNLLASLGYSGSNPLGDGIVSVASFGNSSLLLVDPDGTAGSAIARSYALLFNVNAAGLNNPNNFIFS